MTFSILHRPLWFVCVKTISALIQALLIISLWSFSTSLLHNVDFYQIYLVLYFCDSGPLAWSKARHEVMLLWLRLIDQTIASTVYFFFVNPQQIFFSQIVVEYYQIQIHMYFIKYNYWLFKYKYVFFRKISYKFKI